MRACDARESAAQCKVVASPLIGSRRDLRNSLPDEFPWAQFVLIGEHRAFAFGKSGDDLRKIERAITDLDRAGLDDSVFHNERLIHDQGAGWQQKNILVRAGDDVHLTGHAGHQVLGRVFEIQDDGVTLGLGISGRLDGRNFCAELAGPKGIDLHDGFHPDFHFADIFLIHFSAHIILA